MIPIGFELPKREMPTSKNPHSMSDLGLSILERLDSNPMLTGAETFGPSQKPMGPYKEKLNPGPSRKKASDFGGNMILC